MLHLFWTLTGLIILSKHQTNQTNRVRVTKRSTWCETVTVLLATLKIQTFFLRRTAADKKKTNKRNGRQQIPIKRHQSWSLFSNCHALHPKYLMHQQVSKETWMMVTRTWRYKKKLRQHLYKQKLISVTNSVEWKKRICHIWSRSRHFSLLAVQWPDRYLKLGSPKKRSPGRNLGEHRSVWRSGTKSRGTVLVFFYLFSLTTKNSEVFCR